MKQKHLCVPSFCQNTSVALILYNYVKNNFILLFNKKDNLIVLYFQIMIDSHFEWEQKTLVRPCFDRYLQTIGLKLI